MTKKNIFVVVAVVAILAAAVAYLFLQAPKGPAGNPPPETLYGFDPSRCPGKQIKMTMSDVYLRGILERNQPFTAQLNYYGCNNKPQHGDLVLYRFSHEAEPVVRQIAAVPGDSIEVVLHKGLNAWTLVVNGETYKANNQIYFFGTGSAPAPLVSYAKAHGGKMGDSEVIVFSSFPPGSEDSGVFGAISLVDIIGKVVKDGAPEEATAVKEPEVAPEGQPTEQQEEQKPQTQGE